MLPFGNIVVTLTVNGAELKTMLENGVSLDAGGERAVPAGLGALLHLQHRGGGREPRHRRRCGQAADGTAPATPVDLTAGSTYKIAENDFMATGGDGYPNFVSRATTQDIMDQVLADYVTANSPLNPVVKAGPGRADQLHGHATAPRVAAPNCPTLTPSP